MVRLRSNRWYAADGQRKSHKRVSLQAAGTRRVLSLCLMLALVIVLMQQASNPRHVQQAFQVLGVPLDPPTETKLAESGATHAHATQVANAPAAPSQSNAAAEASSVPPDGSDKWGVTCADVISRILDSLTTNQLNDLAKFWFARAEPTASNATSRPLEANSANHTSLPSEWAERGVGVVASLIEQTAQSPMAADEKAEWLAELKQISSQWQTICNTPATEELSATVSQELRRALTTALDQRLIASLRDASPWTQSESLAFWRLLQRTTANSLAGQTATSEDFAAAPLVNTRQLDAEARALRGQRVRFRGTVHRVERVEREFAPLNMSGGYWVLWLRGEDEALQPVAVYTTDPFAAKLAVQIEQRSNDHPQLEVHAIFAKRLAYASADGLQVGPALMAGHLIPLGGPAPPQPAVTPQQIGSQFLIAVLAACLLAAAILLPIVWGTRRRGKRKNRTSTRLLLLVTAMSWQAWQVTHSQIAWAAPPLDTANAAILHEANTPPWAKANGNPLTEFLTSGGQIPLTATAANELREALHNRSALFPNALLKIIQAVDRVGWMQRADASQPYSNKIIELGEGLQLQERQIAGWVRAATPVALVESQRDWFQSDERAKLFQVELQVQAIDSESVKQEDSANAAHDELLTVYCKRVPAVWLSTARLRQPAQFAAFELIDQTANDAPTLCALAEAPQWLLPKEMSGEELDIQLAPPLTPYVLGLGQLGWDLSYLDTIAEHNQKPLSRDEATGFYSLMRLANSPLEPRETDMGPASQPLALLADAQANVGRPLEWRVRIVTGTLVEVDDPAYQRQLGGEAYVQFDGFVDIGNDRIRFQPTGGPEPAPKLDFSGEFPVTIVAPLNKQLMNSTFVPSQQLGAGQQGWAVGQYATLRGRFYRLWSYQSELVRASTPQGRQVAPLVVASSLVSTIPPQRARPSPVGWFGWALCGSMLLILTVILWLASRPRAQK